MLCTKDHSTETALLYIHDHLINAIGSQKLSCLCLLDLSAAFDTIDHNILISCLLSWFGIHGCVLNWFKSKRKSARMSKITNEGLTRSATGCFIAVPIWQQCASKCNQYYVLVDESFAVSRVSSDDDVNIDDAADEITSEATDAAADKRDVKPTFRLGRRRSSASAGPAVIRSQTFRLGRRGAADRRSITFRLGRRSDVSTNYYDDTTLPAGDDDQFDTAAEAQNHRDVTSKGSSTYGISDEWWPTEHDNLLFRKKNVDDDNVESAAARKRGNLKLPFRLGKRPSASPTFRLGKRYSTTFRLGKRGEIEM